MHIKREHIASVNEPKRFVDYTIGIFPETPSKNAVRKNLKNGLLYLNGKTATTGNWVQTGDRIVLSEDLRKLPKAYELEIEVLFEDDHFAVVLKPSGIAVSGNFHRTLEHALIGKLSISDAEDAYRYARAVHRIDLATIGLVVLAKTISASQHLALQFENREVKKVYFALLAGKDVIDQSIELDVDGKSASSELKVIKKVNSLKNEEITLVELKPQTGRKHQLRKHCLSIGHPIVGDKLYNEKGKTIQHKGMFLFAQSLTFKHPFTSEKMTFEAHIPGKFEALMKREQRRWERYHES